MEFEIRQERYLNFKKKIDKIQNLVARRGGFVSVEVIDTYPKTIKCGLNWVPLKGYNWTNKTVLVNKVRVTSSICEKEWKVVGLVSAVEDGSVMITSISDVTIPKMMYYSTIKCDHCHTNARRKRGFIVYNSKTDEFKMVGTGCLEEYTGINMNAVIKFFELKDEVDGSEPKESREIPNDFIFNLEETMFLFFNINDNNVYRYLTPSRKAEILEELIASIHCNYSKGKKHKCYLPEELKDYTDKVNQYRSWIENFDPIKDKAYSPLNDKEVSFEVIKNLKTLISQTNITSYDFSSVLNFICIAEWNLTGREERQKELQRLEIERLEKIAKDLEDREFEFSVGKVGERVSFEVGSISFSENYSYYLVNATDKEGRHFFWFSNSYKNPEEIKEVSGVIKFQEKNKYKNCYLNTLDTKSVVYNNPNKKVVKPSVSYNVGDTVSVEVDNVGEGSMVRGPYGSFLPVLFYGKDGNIFAYNTSKMSKIYREKENISKIEAVVKKIYSGTYYISSIKY